MKTQGINPLSFNGIKLSFNDKKSADRVVKYLRLNGFDCIGKENYYVNNTFTEKQKMANSLRYDYMFKKNEYGVLFLPWSREIYLVSEPAYEQNMLEWVQEMDSEAYINLII